MTMQGVASEFFSLALVHFLAVIAPGPDFAVTVGQSVKHGRKAGVYTALGIGAGISAHVIYTVLGIGALMHSSSVLMSIVRWAGALYMAYLAIGMLRSRPVHASSDAQLPQAPSIQSAGKAFATGFLTNATNPKATLFFLAIFTTMVSAGTPLHIQAAYGLWMCIVNAVWFVFVSMFFSSASVRAGFLKLGHWFERFMGTLLLGFAAKLVWGNWH
jgi:RhtB (resistance to homoserine/threonine) family protein